MEMSVAYRACDVLLVVKAWAPGTGCGIAEHPAGAHPAAKESAGCEPCNGQRSCLKLKAERTE